MWRVFFFLIPLFLFSEVMEKDAKIFVAGHNGLVGKAIVRKLENEGFHNLVLRSSKELDLKDQQAVFNFFKEEKPDFVFLAAAKVGGIFANNTYPAEFIYNNLMIELNVIHASYLNNVKKLLLLGSSCIYPRECPQPILESYLLTGPLEPTNEPYALAKIAGINLCKSYNRQYGTNFISCMPTNLYGPYDNYSLTSSHVIPAMIVKFVTAKETNAPFVTLWGTGSPYREFLHVDDLADAVYFLMQNYSGNETLNVGTGKDLQIRELAEKIKKAVGYEGEIVYDASKPDGTPKKLLNIDKIQSLGWTPKISLDEGLEEAVKWYLDHKDIARH